MGGVCEEGPGQSFPKLCGQAGKASWGGGLTCRVNPRVFAERRKRNMEIQAGTESAWNLSGEVIILNDAKDLKLWGEKNKREEKNEKDEKNGHVYWVGLFNRRMRYCVWLGSRKQKGVG